MPQLDLSSFLSQIIWLGISFCILYCIVRYYFLPRLEGVIDSRNYIISQYLKEADVLIKQAQEVQMEIYKMLKEANGSAAAIKIEADKKAKLLIAARTKQIDTEAREYIHKEHNRLLSMQQQCMQDIERHVVFLKNRILQLLS